MVTGIIVGAYGFGSFIYSRLAKEIVNFNNEKPNVPSGEIDLMYFEPRIAEKVPFMLQTFVCVWLV